MSSGTIDRPADAAADSPPTPPRHDDESDGRDGADEALASAYRDLQRTVGIIAFALPFVLIIGNKLLSDDPWFQSSISAYYWTDMRNVFVGALCAIGVFLLSYQHRPIPDFRPDRALSTLAAIASVCVALFPTGRSAAEAGWVSAVHAVSAGVLFALLAVFSLFLFTRRADLAPLTWSNWWAQFRKAGFPHRSVRHHWTPRQRRDHATYVTCGVVIIAAILIGAASNIFHWHLFMWMEVVAVLAFAISWLVKAASTVTIRAR